MKKNNKKTPKKDNSIDNIKEMAFVQSNILDFLIQAKEKHPHFANNKHEALSVLMEEVGEIAMAINDNANGVDIEEEIYQTIAVLIRMLTELEHE